MRMTESKITEQAISDSELVAGIRAGNRALYGLLVQRYNRLLYHTAGRVLRAGEDVADVLQEAHFRAFTHIADFKGDSSFPGWLTRIALNEALTCLRKRSRSVEAWQFGDESDDVIARARSASPSPERQAMRQELRQALC